MRIKAQAGESHIDWLPGGAGSSDVHHAAYTLKGDGWEEIAINIPAQESLGIVRIYLPASAKNIDIDWIEISSPTASKTTHTDF